MQKKKSQQNNISVTKLQHQNLYWWHMAKITPCVTLSCANGKKHILFSTENI